MAKSEYFKRQQDGSGKLKQTQQEIKLAKHQEIIDSFGVPLGQALITYTEGRESRTDDWQWEKIEDRRAFAEAIVTTLESGSHEDRVKGISALLQAIDAKIEPVANRVDRTQTVG